MPIAHVMTSGFNIFVLALTPIERWKAAGRFNTGSPQHWFVLTAMAVIIILTTVFLIVSYNRTAKQRKISKQLFFDFSKQRGLSGREREILLKIAHKAGLKKNQAIFSMAGAFDNGAGKMIKESLAQQGAEESKWLRTELSFLREKLGLKKIPSASAGPLAKLKKPGSRHIITGTILQITRRKNPDLGKIECTVIKNDNMELTVKLTTPIESNPGEFWRVYYNFGASVWEFDTSVARCNGDAIVLNHSDDVRLISRRRFLRVPVKKPAFIARFPFSRTLSSNSPAAKQVSVNEPGNTWVPPEFIPATVTELGGSGLRLEAPLEVKAGDRILVIVNLGEEKDRDLISPQKSTPLRSVLTKDKKRTPSKIVEDIGEVKRIRAIPNGFSIAVELTGLNNSNLNELICATNAASIKTNRNSQDTPDSSETEAKVSVPAIVQGD